jgi:isoleucyl-tRNA synthetase
MKFFKRNREDFKRLGIFGQWDKPYLTVDKDYEAGILDVFADLVEGGYIYRALRPVHWCFNCGTALAEAELEYADETSPSIFVRFPMVDEVSETFGAVPGAPVDCLIWTTTPWTLPANLAIALAPRARYALVEYKDPKSGSTRRMFFADDLADKVCEMTGIKSYKVLGVVEGRELEGKRYRHAWLDRTSPIVLADYVTLEDGSGCVHTAPGHGREDFITGQKYKLEIFSPIDDTGRLTDEAPPYDGMVVFEADPKIVADLEASGALLFQTDFSHSYPHCWRCHKPVIFRATEQWFVNIDHSNLRTRMLAEIDKVKWVPRWGYSRIRAMVEGRPDWCISRQRAWGVPIPAFFCEECGHVLISAEIVRHVRDIFAEHGADHWFRSPVEALLPHETRCPQCGNNAFRKESDIFDVWFESGSSHRGVLKNDPQMDFPCDLYLEGSDQHRGWFQVSLITSLAADNVAPFRSVLTHGFVVDEGGEKMSKSRGNFISTSDATSNVGADIFRLWVASCDFRNDIFTSLDAMKRMGDAYRKIRNTFRYLLGNLSDFDPPQQRVSKEELLPIDRWALIRLNRTIQRITEAYEKFEFHRVFSLIYNYCVVDVSSMYLDILKDRMYCDGADWSSRRSGQTVMYDMFTAMVRMLTPILVHTCEEAWQALDKKPAGQDAETIHLATIPLTDESLWDEEFEAEWERLAKVRADVLRCIEPLRKGEQIGSGLEAEVTLYSKNDELLAALNKWHDELPAFFITSTVEVKAENPPEQAMQGEDESDLFVTAKPASHGQCSRCWRYLSDIGSDAANPELCTRCAGVMEALGE